MKILIPLLFVLFSISSAIPVFDRDGDEIKPGVAYIIAQLPSFPGRGGTVTLREDPNNFPCPLNVVVDHQQTGFNIPLIPSLIPVTFHPANDLDTVIHESSAINIYTNSGDYFSGCSQFWEVRSDHFLTSGDQIGIIQPPTPIPKFEIIGAGIFEGDHIYHLYYGKDPVILQDRDRLYANPIHQIGPIPAFFHFLKNSSRPLAEQI